MYAFKMYIPLIANVILLITVYVTAMFLRNYLNCEFTDMQLIHLCSLSVNYSPDSK